MVVQAFFVGGALIHPWLGKNLFHLFMGIGQPYGPVVPPPVYGKVKVAKESY